MVRHTSRLVIVLAYGFSAAIACNRDSTSPIVAARLVFKVAPPDSAQNRAPLSVDPVVQLQDESGRDLALSGRSVTVAVIGGEGELSGPVGVSTGSSGAAAFRGLTVSGRAGVRTITFSTAGIPSLSANVMLIAGTPERIEPVSSVSQTAVAGDEVPEQPAVKLLDADTNVIAGTRVVFSVEQGGGAISPDTVVTDVGGMARAENWILGPLAGTNTLRARVPSVSPELSVAFTATGTTPRIARDSAVI